MSSLLQQRLKDWRSTSPTFNKGKTGTTCVSLGGSRKKRAEPHSHRRSSVRTFVSAVKKKINCLWINSHWACLCGKMHLLKKIWTFRRSSCRSVANATIRSQIESEEESSSHLGETRPWMIHKLLRKQGSACPDSPQSHRQQHVLLFWFISSVLPVLFWAVDNSASGMIHLWNAVITKRSWWLTLKNQSLSPHYLFYRQSLDVNLPKKD